MNKRLDKQMDFIREIDKEKFITRMTKLTDGKRRENDAEHAWHMAIMTILLSEYANEKIDVLRTVTMLLIHDLVEIDAGDTYAYDEEGKKTQDGTAEVIYHHGCHTYKINAQIRCRKRKYILWCLHPDQNLSRSDTTDHSQNDAAENTQKHRRMYGIADIFLCLRTIEPRHQYICTN